MTLIDKIAKALEAGLSKFGEVSIALSGGSSPTVLYEGLSSIDLDWARVRVTLIDDRLPHAHMLRHEHRLYHILQKGCI